MASRVLATPDRALGKSERNWCAVVGSGTGITVTGILFGKHLTLPLVEAAVGELLARQPRLQSEITKKDDTLWFKSSDKVSRKVCVIDRHLEAEDPGADGEEIEAAGEQWVQIMEEEMNTPFPEETPFPVFKANLYQLPNGSSLLVFRSHSAAADLASTSSMAREFLTALHEFEQAEKSGQSIEALLEKTKISEDLAEEVHLPSLEDAIPRGQARKPFWAHGVDVVGYGLASRRHAYLPFADPSNPRNSRLIRAALTAQLTKELVKDCKQHKSTLFGAIHAAGLKAVAAFKKVGNKGEHYGTAVLLNCRHLLHPVISNSQVGFYNAAMMKTTHTSESMSFWELAAKCSKEFDEAVKNRKHFTDIGDLNALMVQAMKFPQLTPSGTLRMTLFSLGFDPVDQDLGEAATALNVKDHAVCSSVHGAGPCLAIFPFIRDGSLHFSFIYSSPLFTRKDIQKLVDLILFYLSGD